MPLQKTVLITGANRGIGRALAEACLQKDNTSVLACVRSPRSASSRSLAEMKPAPGSSIHLIELDVTNKAHYAALSKSFSDLGIETLDIVIANAGIFASFTRVEETDAEDLSKHLQINTIGPMLLFQATRDLLLKGHGKFVAVSALSGSISEMEKVPIPATAHGTSKAALNYVVRKIHFENPEMSSFSLDPGFVQTDLGDHGAQRLGLDKKGMPAAESARSMLKVIEEASREKTSGIFMQYNGGTWSW